MAGCALLEEATVDCYDEEEQMIGLWTMIDAEVVRPFSALVIGEKVTVIDLLWPQGSDEFTAVCEHNGKRYEVGLASLEGGKSRPQGFKWIEVYLAWRKNQI